MFHSTIITHSNAQVRNTYIETVLLQEKINKIDQLFLDDESIGIAQIRKLMPFISQKPIYSRFKVIIISGDNLTLEAQQALLKLLEEPPEYVHMYISISQSEKLIGTILSRTKLVQLNSIENLEIGDSDKMGFYWKELLSQSPISRLKNMVIPTERDELKVWLKDAIFFMRNQLLRSYSVKNNAENEFNTATSIQIIEQLIKTFNEVERNASLKLSLDHLLLSINYRK